jgi:hypothetical protein
VTYLGEEIKLASLNERGLVVLTGFPVYLATIERLIGNLLAEDDRHHLQQFTLLASDDAKFAREEVARGFPVLLAHSTVSIWCAVETMLDDLLAASILNIPNALNLITTKHALPRFATITANESEAMELVRAWARSLKSTDIIDRYNAMLGIFDFDVKLDDHQKQTLAELNEVRNLILHRKSIVDKKFVKKISGTNCVIGQQYIIDREKFLSFYDAASAFTIRLLDRVTHSPWIQRSRPERVDIGAR